MAQLGEQLLTPEDGWKEFIFSNSTLIFSSYSYRSKLLTKSSISSSVTYLFDKYNIIYGHNDSLEKKYNLGLFFKFSGDKIRIINFLDKRTLEYNGKKWDPAISVYIDGKYEGQIFHEFSKSSNLSKDDVQTDILCFEKENLNNDEHICLITLTTIPITYSSGLFAENGMSNVVLQTIHLPENAEDPNSFDLIYIYENSSLIEKNFKKLAKNQIINKNFINTRFMFYTWLYGGSSSDIRNVKFDDLGPVNISDLINTDEYNYYTHTHTVNDILIDDLKMRINDVYNKTIIYRKPENTIFENELEVREVDEDIYNISNYSVTLFSKKKIKFEEDEDGFLISEELNLNDDYKDVIEISNDDEITFIPNDLYFTIGYDGIWSRGIQLSNTDIIRDITYTKSHDDIYVKFLVSSDASGWKYFDTETNDWKNVTIDTEIVKNGIEDFSVIPEDKWRELLEFDPDSLVEMDGQKAVPWRIYITVLIGIKVPDDLSTYDPSPRTVSNFTILQGKEYSKVPDIITPEISFNTNFKYTYTDEDDNKHYISLNTFDKKYIENQYNTNYTTLQKLTTLFTNEEGKKFEGSKSDSTGWLRIPSSDEFKKYILTDPDFGYSKNSKEYIYDLESKAFTTAQYDDEADCQDNRLRLELVIADPELISRPDSETTFPISSDFTSVSVGEAVPCWYTTTEKNRYGTFDFDSTDKENKKLITDIGESIPDGKFYFICVDEYNSKKIFIADRNIQSNISYETLNNVKNLCTNEGTEIDLPNNLKGSIRLPNTYAIKTVTKNDHGEWDDYITYNNQNGFIPSDNNIWNTQSVYSWTLPTYYSDSETGTNYIIRGKQNKDNVPDTINQKYKDYSFTDDIVGFRPVLEVDLSGITILMSNIKINTTHVNIHNQNNKSIPIDGNYSYLKSKELYKNTEFKAYLNDDEIERDKITINNDESQSFHFDININDLETGNNTVLIKIITTDMTDLEIINSFNYNIELEDNNNAVSGKTKTRDYKYYTDGFNLNGLEISSNQVINKNKFLSNKIETNILIPENTVRIIIKEID